MEFANISTDRLFIQKGQYAVTDPCYLFDTEWAKLCNDYFCNEKLNTDFGVLVVKVDGKEFHILWSTTKYGDGMYKVKKHSQPVGEFGVDAGMFCLVPLEFVENYAKEDATYLEVGELEAGTVKVSNCNMNGCGIKINT